jgi:LPXTG-motif cell wall-anchored protein
LPPAARLDQVPNTDTPTATLSSTPTSTSIPTSTPTATSTTVVNTPPPASTSTLPGSTSTPIVSTKPPNPGGGGGGGGGGGAPPGPGNPPAINGCVRVADKNGLSLSTEPGFYQPHVQVVPHNEVLLVIDGPQRADQIWWWRLRTTQGVEGWGNQDLITPDVGPCAPVGLSQIAATPQIISTGQQLPKTGSGFEGWFLGGLLAAVLVLAGMLRRKFQAETNSGSHISPKEKKL